MDKKDNYTVEQFLQNFTLELITLDTKQNDKVYYTLEMELKDRRVKWRIEKRFSDFETLHLDLSKTTIELPYLPPKSLFKLQQQDLQKRKSDLQKYLKSLVVRPDILQNEIFQEFLELNKYGTVPKQVNYRQLGSISGFSMKVRDIHYEESQGIIFVLIGDNDLKTKVGGFLSSLLGTNKKGDPCGRLICLRAKNQYTFDFNKLWHIDFYSHPQCMHFDPKLTMVAVGLYNGDIEIYRVKVEKNYQSYEDYCIIKRHTSAITAVHLDFQSATVYSISKDKAFLVTNIANNDSHYRIDGKIQNQQDNFQVNQYLHFKTEKILTHPLTALCVDSVNERVFIGDSIGSIYVYSTVEPIQIITSVFFEYENQINAIHITKQRNYILFGHATGLIRVFELKKKGSVKEICFQILFIGFNKLQDRVLNPISAITGPDNLHSLSFSLKDKEIYSNCSNSLLIIDSAHNLPISNQFLNISVNIYSFYSIVSINAHKDLITKIQYVEERNIFVTASKDFTVKFWKLRGSKDDKESEFEQLYLANQNNKHQQKQVAELQAEIQKSSINPIEESRQKFQEKLEKEKKEQEQKRLQEENKKKQQKLYNYDSDSDDLDSDDDDDKQNRNKQVEAKKEVQTSQKSQQQNKKIHEEIKSESKPQEKSASSNQKQQQQQEQKREEEEEEEQEDDDNIFGWDK
ncbi:hypothetical protein ABPG74_016073 [Tetrahymena malaccensis]